MPDMPSDSKLSELQANYRAVFEQLDGDLSGRQQTQAYLENSTAIYHDAVIGLGFLPKIYDGASLRWLDQVVSTTTSILAKVTERFIADADYRALFGFSPLLEWLISLPTGYDSPIPIMRVDIFLNEQTLDFQFCEFNTDGTSAMNEDREGANALTRSNTWQLAAPQLGLVRQELFEGWVEHFLQIYHSSSMAVAKPLIAIVDYAASGTPYEFEEFRRRFEQHGYRCLIVDVPDLEYRDGSLYGRDYNPEHPTRGQLQRIDTVYRRAVTGELLTELEAAGQAVWRELIKGDSAPSATQRRGAFALVQAAAAGAVCLIGGFRTQVAHSKQVFAVLHQPQTAEFLTLEERDFVHQHIPSTTVLDAQHIDLAAIKSDKNRWIIKPRDGYASKGVHAGRDFPIDDWAQLIDEHADGSYIVQSYAPQFATPNVRSDADADLSDWNILTGLYAYDGHFSGIFTRAGQNALIVGFAGGITVPTVFSGADAIATTELRVRETD